MSYELWRDLEEESDSEGQGRKPEIGHVFLMDRGGLRQGQRPEGSCLGSRSPGGAGKACVGWLEDCEGRLAPSLLADTDYVTALCSQVVYEGLVDDTFRIKCGRRQGSTGLCTHNGAEWGSAHTWPASAGFVPGLALSGTALFPQGQSQCGVLLEVIHRDSPHSDQDTGLASPVSPASYSEARACGNVAMSGTKQLFTFPCRQRGFWARCHLF